MRKLVIPVVICALALVGAVLLLLPVEDAMAVHTTLGTPENINKQDRYLTFYISANATANSEVIILPARGGNTYIVHITAMDLDGDSDGPLLFEDTTGVAVPTGSLVTVTADRGLRIADIRPNTEHFVSVVIGEDDE